MRRCLAISFGTSISLVVVIVTIFFRVALGFRLALGLRLALGFRLALRGHGSGVIRVRLVDGSRAVGHHACLTREVLSPVQSKARQAQRQFGERNGQTGQLEPTAWPFDDAGLRWGHKNSGGHARHGVAGHVRFGVTWAFVFARSTAWPTAGRSRWRWTGRRFRAPALLLTDAVLLTRVIAGRAAYGWTLFFLVWLGPRATVLGQQQAHRQRDHCYQTAVLRHRFHRLFLDCSSVPRES